MGRTTPVLLGPNLVVTHVADEGVRVDWPLLETSNVACSTAPGDLDRIESRAADNAPKEPTKLRRPWLPLFASQATLVTAEYGRD